MDSTEVTIKPLEFEQLPSIGTTDFLTVPEKVFSALVERVNTLSNLATTHDSTITTLLNEVQALKENMAKVAEILEVIYEKT